MQIQIKSRKKIAINFQLWLINDVLPNLRKYELNKQVKNQIMHIIKTKCGKEIEICLKSMLNKYIYKTNKEFYNCNIDIIIIKISKWRRNK